MDFQQSLAYLYSLGHEVLAAKFGLENIRCLLDALGRPERAFRSVIVAGTNGKGSTAAMLESIVRLAGHRTALYTSPHLVRLEERIRVAGKEISEIDFARHAAQVRTVSEALVHSGRLTALPTFFEQLTAIALNYFCEREVELSVLEIGVGGHEDAVNVVNPIATVITAIDYDHQNLLGNTIAEITSVKAGVIKPATPVIIGRQRHLAAMEGLMRRCLEIKALPVFANEPANVSLRDDGQVAFDYDSSHSQYTRIVLGLKGRHQAENATAAIEAAELLSELGFNIPRAAIVKGLRRVHWPGRLELLDERPCLLLEGAHKRAGARTLRAYLDEFWNNRVVLIFGAMSDKDIAGMASELFSAAKTIFLTRLNDPRAASPAALSRLSLSPTNNLISTESVQQALAWARSVTPPDGLICATGSLQLIGEVKRLIETEQDSV
ncbi:MAG: dihydrofolate synthase / folylpolyglutamate synthase [Blastocatellia bacterium]